MSAIRFCTTLKVDLPHYSYIFKKPEPLDMELNNVACYRFGTMLYLEIQNEEEATKTEKLQQQIGGTVVCMKILKYG